MFLPAHGDFAAATIKTHVGHHVSALVSTAMGVKAIGLNMTSSRGMAVEHVNKDWTLLIAALKGNYTLRLELKANWIIR